MTSIWTSYAPLGVLYSEFIVVYLPCLFNQAPSGAAFCRIQPEAERYACSDRLKTSVLGEVLSSLVLLRFYPSESASEQAYRSASGVTCRKPNIPPLQKSSYTTRKSPSRNSFQLLLTASTILFLTIPALKQLPERRRPYAVRS